MRGPIRRTAIEAGISAVIAFAVSLIVFGPLLASLDEGWSGGDMLSTYVNSVNWGGFSYTVTTQFGFPLGMNLNYFPGIDITENTFALLVNSIAGTTFLGINLLIVLSFPLVAALAYLVMRMTGLQGPIAIALAIAFTFIPFHWGRALGHTYLSTLYSAVIGLALVLLVGSGQFERLLHGRTRRRRLLFIGAVAAMVVTVAWTGVYYVAFTLILGGAALLWRFGQRASFRTIGIEAIPFAGIGVLAAVGFVPALLTLRAAPPLASLGERLPYESVTFAGNLAMALLPLPQSMVPGLGFYNTAVVEAIQAAPFGESTAITNHGTWITSAALVVLLVALLLRSRRPAPPPTDDVRVSLGLISYLIVVVVLFFVPWGLNYLVAGTLTAQIRAWNRLLPFLLLLFLLGAAAALARTRLPGRLAYALPIALVVIGVTAVDSVLPFREAYADSVAEGSERTRAAREYAPRVNDAIPGDCGVLQLPYMAYPEYGVIGEVNDYDHFWSSITNEGKEWSYGAVKNTVASVWAAQLPELPTDAQVELLRGAGFCGLHLDTRAFISERLPDLRANLSARFGPPVATGYDDQWELYALGSAPVSPASAADAFVHQPLITSDPVTVGSRATELERVWWWTTDSIATFALTPTTETSPVTAVTGRLRAPDCGVAPVTVRLTSGTEEVTTTVIASPESDAQFTLELTQPTSTPANLTIETPGEGCPANGVDGQHYVKVLDLQTS